MNLEIKFKSIYFNAQITGALKTINDLNYKCASSKSAVENFSTSSIYCKNFCSGKLPLNTLYKATF